MLVNLLLHINSSLITKQLTNLLGIHQDQNSSNSLQNLMNSLMDLDSLCSSAWKKKTMMMMMMMKAKEQRIVCIHWPSRLMLHSGMMLSNQKNK